MYTEIFWNSSQRPNVDYFWSEKLIIKTQYGSRKRFSTTDVITYCTEFLRSETDKSKYVSAALLDFSKAFDSINHKILNGKLDKIGFSTSSGAFNQKFSFSSRAASKITKQSIGSN